MHDLPLLPANCCMHHAIPSQAKYVGQTVTANGNQARFAHRYNYVRQGVYTIGSASQDYVCLCLVSP